MIDTNNSSRRFLVLTSILVLGISTVAAAAVHDLAVTGFNAEGNATVGEYVSLNVTVENRGDFNESATLTVKDTSDGEVIEERDIDLNTGQTDTFYVGWDTSGETGGSHELEASVTGVSNETDTSDNSKTTTVYLEEVTHDVAVTSIDTVSTATVGDTVNVDFTVENQGDETETTQVRLTNTENGNVIGSEEVTVSPGETRTVSYTWDSSGLSDGEYTLEAEAEQVNGEEDTSDNRKTATVTFEPASNPPAVDSFKAYNGNSKNPHIELNYDWSVSDQDGDLDSVSFELRDSSTGYLVDSWTRSVSGSTASGGDYRKYKKNRGTFDFEITVTDSEGNTASASETVYN